MRTFFLENLLTSLVAWSGDGSVDRQMATSVAAARRDMAPRMMCVVERREWWSSLWCVGEGKGVNGASKEGRNGSAASS